MTISKYFRNSLATEQGLLEDLVTESIQHRGMDLLYIPRTIVDVNELFSEDRFSTYDEVFEIEMYPINQTGYEGQGDLLSKFGIQVDQTGSFIVSRKRWLAEASNVSSLQIPDRPGEGDLLYYPMSKSLFKINVVEASSPFFQLQRRYVWELKVSLVDYTYNELNTGNQEVDNVFGSIQSEMIDKNELEPGQRKHSGQNDMMIEKANDIIDWDSSDPFGNK